MQRERERERERGEENRQTDRRTSLYIEKKGDIMRQREREAREQKSELRGKERERERERGGEVRKIDRPIEGRVYISRKREI